MTHFLVDQLRFSRTELQRCLAGISDTDARHRHAPMNCISWMVGHLASQEQYYWCDLGQGQVVNPQLNELVGFGKPASQPPLADMWNTWEQITDHTNPYLDTLTPALMAEYIMKNGERSRETVGTMLLRTIHHYWFHIGEAHAIRQLLGHKNLPDFVGNMSEAGFKLYNS